jgi:hypothetical protein
MARAVSRLYETRVARVDGTRAVALRCIILCACVARARCVARGGGVATAMRRTTIERDARPSARARSTAATASAATRLRGGVLGTGTLVAEYALADGQTYDLIVDTGSARTYVPCKGCARCGEHAHGYYDYDRSMEFERLDCGEASDATLCEETMKGTCQSDGRCSYVVSYAEGSSSRGYVVRDRVRLGEGTLSAMLAFGCEEAETNAIYEQKADGLFGFGRGTATVHAQLASAGLIENVFSFCVEGFGANGGVLTLGRFDFGADAPALARTPLVADPANPAFHNVRTSSWKLGDSLIEHLNSYTTTLDSGTTFTFVPRSVWDSFKTRLDTQATQAGLEIVAGPDPQYDDVCYGVSAAAMNMTLSQSTVSEWFPPLTIAYEGGVSLTLGPENYLFAHETNSAAFCVGIFANPNNQILLGQITMRDTLMEFDVANSRVGMAPANCRRLREKYTHDSPEPTPSNSSTPSGGGDALTEVFVSLGALIVAIIGVCFGSKKLQRSDVFANAFTWASRGNERQWQRLEDDVSIDAQIEMSDMP